jgi:Holliday junction resolvase RusA-like endonuclease
MNPPSLRLTVPVPPSLNNAYTNGKGHGRRVLSKEGRDYKATIAQLLLCRAHPVGGFELAINQPKPRIGMHIKLWFATRQRRDISNCVKLLEDALSEGLGFDDCAVDKLYVERAGYDAAQPRCEVVIEVLS